MTARLIRRFRAGELVYLLVTALTVFIIACPFRLFADEPPNVAVVNTLVRELPEATFGPIAGVSCKPSVPLADLRFAWRDEEGLHAELTYESAVIDEFWKTFPEHNPANNGKLDGRMTPEQQAWVFQHTKEKSGQALWLYRPSSGNVALAHIIGSDYLYDGYDGAFQFRAQLKPAGGGSDMAKDGCFIASSSSTKPRMTTKKLVALPSTAQDKLGLSSNVGRKNGDRILSCVKTPRADLFIATVRDEASDVLECFWCANRRLTEAQLPSANHNTLFVVADRPANFYSSQMFTTIYVLPDFDGDGHNEILVNSTSTELYDTSGAAKGALSLVRQSYYVRRDACPAEVRDLPLNRKQ